MTTGRRLVFVAGAMGLAIGVSSTVLIAVDVYLHQRYERSAGFNVWGYRGPTAGRKQPTEYRIVVVGGSAAYGYGVSWEEAMPAVLERRLNERAPRSRTFTVINLAYNNEGAYSFKPTLEDYRWLHEDLVVFYEGYNDLVATQPNVQVFRHESPVFRLTGYLPIFPIIFKEKAAAMLGGGDAGALYRHDNRTVFHAGLATKAAAGVLAGTAAVAESLEAQLGRVSAEPAHSIDDVAPAGCRSPWQTYCRSVAVAVTFARATGRQVMVVTQPYLAVGTGVRARHLEQQHELRAMIERQFASDPAVRYLNLGDRVDLGNPDLSFDHMHLTAAGNRELADGLVEPVLEMATEGRSAGP